MDQNGNLMGHPQWIWGISIGIPQATHGTQPENRRFTEVTVVGAAPIIRSQAPHGRWDPNKTEMNELKELGSNPGVEMEFSSSCSWILRTLNLKGAMSSSHGAGGFRWFQG